MRKKADTRIGIFAFVFMMFLSIQGNAFASMPDNHDSSHWGQDTVNAQSAWSIGLTGKGVNIAVFDSGVRNHIAFERADGTNALVAQINCFTDKQCKSDTSITSEHGSHVAGIIATQHKAGNRIQGIAPGANIYSVRVTDNGVGEDNHTSGFALERALDWAIATRTDSDPNNDIHIINMSLGINLLSRDDDWISWDFSPPLDNKLHEAYESGILLVASAGNNKWEQSDENPPSSEPSKDNMNDVPGKHSDVIAVGAGDIVNGEYKRAKELCDGERCFSSTTGPEIDISAPGVNIESTIPIDSYMPSSGTSQATPFVSGVLALYKEAYPNDTADQLKAKLYESAIPVSGYTPEHPEGTLDPNWEFGHGLVQAPTKKPFVSGTRLAILSNFDVRSEPNDNSPILKTFTPITAIALERQGNWYKVRTSIGDVWTNPVNAIEGEFKIQFTEDVTDVYDDVEGVNLNKGFKPITIPGIWVQGGGKWFQVATTYIGNVWTKPKNPIIDEKPFTGIFHAINYVNTYDLPSSNVPSGAVKGDYTIATEAYGFFNDDIVKWYKIETPDGYKWVLAIPEQEFVYLSKKDSYLLYNRDSFNLQELKKTQIYKKSWSKPTDTMLNTFFSNPTNKKYTYVFFGSTWGDNYTASFWKADLNIPLYEYNGIIGNYTYNQRLLLVKYSDLSKFSYTQISAKGTSVA